MAAGDEEFYEVLQRIRELWRIEGNAGYPAASLGAWEQKFGEVPATLASYYRTLGAHRELNETQDALVVPDDAEAGYHRMANVPESDHLVFYVENQWALLWGIAPADVALSDPIVWVSPDGVEWETTGDPLSLFLLAQAHMQRVLSYEDNSEEYWEIDEVGLEKLASTFPLILKSRLYDGTDFYGSREQLIMVNRSDGGYLVWFAAENEESLDDLFEWFETLDEGEGAVTHGN